MRATRLIGLAFAALAGEATALELSREPGALRIASFNAAMARQGAGVLVTDIAKRDDQVRNVAEIVLRVRPDVLVINELDRDPAGHSLGAFAEVLAGGVAGLDGIAYPHRYQGPQNTGVPSGHDLDGDGRVAGPKDAYGFGRFPGQYAMAVYSRLPIREEEIRSFQTLPWSAMPGALRPGTDAGPYHSDAAWAALRLSSKSHWVLPVELPDGRVLHVLAAHPTPPVFDGAEDLNGRRNHDEIRLIAALIDGEAWPVDDKGRAGGLPEGALFVVAGDLNSDPEDGDSRRGAVADLLAHPRIQDPAPTSAGAAEAARAETLPKTGDPARHTADWPEGRGKPGNLRVDYVLPSAELRVTGSGVFWPVRSDPLSRLVKTGRPHASSDHRLVWVDIAQETKE